jgi:uncharacterized protein with PIN domain
MTANVIAVDTSALIAIVLNESDHPMFLDRLKSARHAAISTVSYQFERSETLSLRRKPPL